MVFYNSVTVTFVNGVTLKFNRKTRSFLEEITEGRFNDSEYEKKLTEEIREKYQDGEIQYTGASSEIKSIILNKIPPRDQAV